MKNNLIDLTSHLIQVPSVTGNLKACNESLELVKRELKDFKFKEFEKKGVRSLLFYNTPTIPKKFRLILNAHLDVVPANSEQFNPIIKGDKLYGRGAQDMKSGAAAMILAFKETAAQVDYPFALQVVTDEETGGFNGVKYQIEKGIHTDCIIAGESTNLEIITSSKGIVWVRLSVLGKAAHGAYLWQGKNAVDMILTTLNKLREKYPEPTSEVWKTTMNISSVSTSNIAQNKVPGDAQAVLDFRIIPEDRETFIKKLKALVGPKVKLEFMADEPVQETSVKHPDVKKLADALNKSGITPKYAKHHGGSDVRFYSSAKTSALQFGPTGAGIHTDNEWVSIKSIEKCKEILQNFILSL
jgi:succinyl-diaminopimelate desuccinylase